MRDTQKMYGDNNARIPTTTASNREGLYSAHLFKEVTDVLKISPVSAS